MWTLFKDLKFKFMRVLFQSYPAFCENLNIVSQQWGLECQPFWHRRRRKEGRERSWACCCCCHKWWDGQVWDGVLAVMATVSPAALAASLASCRQGTGEVGGRNKADLQLWVVCCPCLLSCSSVLCPKLSKKGPLWLENISTDCHLEGAVWPAFQDSCMDHGCHCPA